MCLLINFENEGYIYICSYNKPTDEINNYDNIRIANVSLQQFLFTADCHVYYIATTKLRYVVSSHIDTEPEVSANYLLRVSFTRVGNVDSKGCDCRTRARIRKRIRTISLTNHLIT